MDSGCFNAQSLEVLWRELVQAADDPEIFCRITSDADIHGEFTSCKFDSMKTPKLLC